MPQPSSFAETIHRQQRNFDILFLVAISLISSIPFVFHLGFYYDDWATLNAFSHRDVVNAVHVLLSFDSGMRVRPMQTLYTAMNIEAFGLNPVGYHIVSMLLVAILSASVYLTGVLLRLPRILALTLALVFSLLPHYSSDRIWFSSQQAVLCMIFGLLGICALFRSTAPNAKVLPKWVAAATVFFALSLLCYEVGVGLIAAAVAFYFWNRWRESRNLNEPVLPLIRNGLGLVILLALLFVLKVMHQSRVPFTYHSIQRLFAQIPEFTSHAFLQMVKFSFWTYGIHLPQVLMILRHQNVLNLGAMITALAISVLSTAYLWHNFQNENFPSRRNAFQMLGLSAVLFFLGYVLFFPYIATEFSTASLANRVVIASALAPACALISILALICSLLPAGKLQNGSFAIALGLSCGMNSLATSGIAQFWIESASAQKQILNSVMRSLPQLPNHSTVILDGFCRYRGPAIILESGWDTTSAVQIALDNFTIRADVLSTDLRLGETSVEGLFDGAPTDLHYSYGSQLFIFGVRDQSLTRLNSGSDARAYLRLKNPTGDGRCLSSLDEYGVALF
jgi:hypothetical protein